MFFRLREYRTIEEAVQEWRRLGLPSMAGDQVELRSSTFVYVDGDNPASIDQFQEIVSEMGGRAYRCSTPSPKLLIAASPDILRKMTEEPRWGASIRRSVEGHGSNKAPPIPLGCNALRFDRTLVMGVLNVTPDSFSDGGEHLGDRAMKRALEIGEEGADILDIGGESTRPYSSPVSEEEEMSRVIPILKEIAPSLDIPISIDTTKPSVAAKALECGASIINDISGLGDERMIEVVAKADVPVVLMHMRGTPKTMQTNIRYDDVVADIALFLHQRIENAKRMGLKEEKIIIDPGIGFGKEVQHNLEIIRRLRELRCLGRPILVGTSRKGFIGRILDQPEGGRMEGTMTTVAACILNGANVVRVHDVKENVLVAKMSDALMRP